MSVRFFNFSPNNYSCDCLNENPKSKVKKKIFCSIKHVLDQLDNSSESHKNSNQEMELDHHCKKLNKTKYSEPRAIIEFLVGITHGHYVNWDVKSEVDQVI